MTPDELQRAEKEWSTVLLAEAKRDLVFIFNIAAGAFGDPKHLAGDELPGVIERMAQLLLAGGCIFGFGDPDSPDWSVPDTLKIPLSEVPAAIRRLWMEDPDNYSFLVFARRQSQ